MNIFNERIGVCRDFQHLAVALRTLYEDAKRWGGLMKTVTESRYMPPWLPEPGYGAFAGERRLTEEDIALVKAWVEAGMPEGDGSPPTAPLYGSDWELGTPDMVLEMASPMQRLSSGQIPIVHRDSRQPKQRLKALRSARKRALELNLRLIRSDASTGIGERLERSWRDGGASRRQGRRTPRPGVRVAA
jgi:hypothetical protein